MKGQEFLDAFLKALEPLSPAERQQITEYYDEYICDGMEQGEPLGHDNCRACAPEAPVQKLSCGWPNSMYSGFANASQAMSLASVLIWIKFQSLPTHEAQSHSQKAMAA